MGEDSRHEDAVIGVGGTDKLEVIDASGGHIMSAVAACRRCGNHVNPFHQLSAEQPPESIHGREIQNLNLLGIGIGGMLGGWCWVMKVHSSLFYFPFGQIFIQMPQTDPLPIC